MGVNGVKPFYPIASPHIFSPMPSHPSCPTKCGAHCIASHQQLGKCNSESIALEIQVRRMPTSSPSVPTPTGDPAAEEWSPWSVCSTTCGEGWQTRTRFCVSSSYSTQCSGPLREQRQCNNSAVCPGGLSTPWMVVRRGMEMPKGLAACDISAVIWSWREMALFPFPSFVTSSRPC